MIVAAPTAPAIGQPTRELPLWVENVSKWYGPVIGVNQISLRVEGGILAVLGPNGAGKSTLMKLLTGQLRPSLGHLRVFGRSVRSPAARRKLGYCPDVDAFYEEMTGRDFVRAMLRLSGYPTREADRRADAALEMVGMNDDPESPRGGKRIAGGSKGMRQRIKLAQAIAHDPELLILDEPLSGLDPMGRRDFCALFRRLGDAGKTIVLASHVMAEVKSLADRVVLVGNGRIRADGPWSAVVANLDARPQEWLIGSPQARALAALLLAWPGALGAQLEAERVCRVTTRDGPGLCDEVNRIVRERGLVVSRLRPTEQWAEVLFDLAEGG